MNKPLYFTLRDPQLTAKVKAVAEAEGRSVANTVSKLLNEALKVREENKK